MGSSAIPALFTPLKVGDIELSHRVALAPLTRYRADAKHVHTELGAQYYAQRGAEPGTLLITEATFIAARAGGYNNVPGIYNDAQIAAWKRIVDAVHAQGSYIFLQLWALGRAAKPEVLKQEPEGPFDIVSASDVAFPNGATPRPLTEEEIEEYIGLYAQAAKNFVHGAGGDGVEIHGANGYLIDQFLQKNSNKRTDKWGGSVENRTRFGLAVVDAVAAAVGEEKTGIRMSPYSTFQGMKMAQEDIEETFGYYVTRMKERHPKMAYIHAVEGRIAGNTDVAAAPYENLDFIYDIWTPNVLLVAGGLTAEKAYKLAEERKNTVTVWGRQYISNPDLPARLREGVAFTPYDRSTFYTGTSPHPEIGYTDYPRATQLKAKA